MADLTTLLVGAAMVVGLLGTVLPLVPGLALIWGAALAYGLLDGFGVLGWVSFLVITLLLVGGTVAKYVLSHRASTAEGIGTTTTALAGVLGIVGLFVIPVVGFPVGFVGGIVLSQYRRSRDWSRAWQVTTRVLRGYGLGVLLEVVAGTAMVAWWLLWVLAG